MKLETKKIIASEWLILLCLIITFYSSLALYREITLRYDQILTPIYFWRHFGLMYTAYFIIRFTIWAVRTLRQKDVK